MLWLILLGALVVALAGALYLRSEGAGPVGFGLTALRVVSLGALLLLLVNPPGLVRRMRGPPSVLLDASLSMGAAGGHWRAAIDTARALAGTEGVILRFGSEVAQGDTAPPQDGASRVADALAAASALGGPLYVVSDAELTDWEAVPPALGARATYVVLPRDTVPDAAIVEVALPDRIRRDDSLRVTLALGKWGGLAADSAEIEVWVGSRGLVRRHVWLGSGPGTVHREIVIPPGVLGEGEHVVRIRVRAAGDVEPRDDERVRVIAVSRDPAVVVVVDPADFEGRFLISTLRDVARTTVRGYWRIGGDDWLDAASLIPVSPAAVRVAVREARLVVVRGSVGWIDDARAAGAVWWWPADGDTATDRLAGEWYVTSTVPPSPIAGPLGGVSWEELPPLTGLIPVSPVPGEWIGLTARQGRRGIERPVLVGRDSGGTRELLTTGAGLWRWAFRGGAAREAYRAVVAAGTDWLLASGAGPAPVLEVRSSAVQRGVPLEFHWARGEPPDSLPVTFISARDSAFTHTLRFDAGAVARLVLPVGTFGWVATPFAGSRGTVVVEPYSDEFRPRRVAPVAGGGRPGGIFEERRARARWWLFVLAMLAFVAEWGWRQRLGLP